jgi:putative selenate reductase
VTTPNLPASERHGFAEVVLTLSRAEAEREASRCLDCDLLCSTCDSVCPNRAIFTYSAQPKELRVPQPTVEDGVITGWTAASFVVSQGPQVAVLSDACNECGNCVTFCPTSGRPWLDKPRLYLNRSEFDVQTDNAFALLKRHTARAIQARFGGELHQLTEDGGLLRYVSPAVELCLDSETLVVVESKALGEWHDRDLFDPQQLAAMLVLHRSFAVSMPEFPLVTEDSQ